MTRILLVDDDDQVRAMLKEVLSSSGYEVWEANDGTGVCKLYEAQRFDLVITDLIMPGIEGIELIIGLRQIDENVKIVAMSGAGANSPETYLKIASKLGAQQILSKPFTIPDFLATVSSALESDAASIPPE
jgi:two-component system response regulator HydG